MCFTGESSFSRLLSDESVGDPISQKASRGLASRIWSRPYLQRRLSVSSPVFTARHLPPSWAMRHVSLKAISDRLHCPNISAFLISDRLAPGASLSNLCPLVADSSFSFASTDQSCSSNRLNQGMYTCFHGAARGRQDISPAPCFMPLHIRSSHCFTRLTCRLNPSSGHMSSSTALSGLLLIALQ